MRIGIDFDGTIAEGEPLAWRPGAREFVLSAHRAGHELFLHSGRCNPVHGRGKPQKDAQLSAARWNESGLPDRDAEWQWDRFDEMRRFLQAGGVWDLLHCWQAPGKIHCDLYVDDRADQPDFVALIDELGLR